MLTFVKRALVVVVCSLLGGLSSCGVGASAGAPFSELDRSLGAVIAVGFGWFAGAVVSVVSASVWLRTDVPRAARRLWWRYLLTAVAAACGVVWSVRRGGSFGFAWVALFSGAWTSAAFTVGAIAWSKIRPQHPLETAEP
jgi:hypothetical protein